MTQENQIKKTNLTWARDTIVKDIEDCDELLNFVTDDDLIEAYSYKRKYLECLLTKNTKDARRLEDE